MPTSPQAQPNLFGLPSGTACWCIQNCTYQFLHRRYVWDMIQPFLHIPFLQIPFLHEPLVISNPHLLQLEILKGSLPCRSRGRGEQFTFPLFRLFLDLWALLYRFPPFCNPRGCPWILSRSCVQILPVSTNKNKNFEHFFIFPKRDRAEIANQQLGQAKLPRTVRDMDWAVLGGEI